MAQILLLRHTAKTQKYKSLKKTKKLNNQEKNNSQSNGNKKLIERIQIPLTPFTAIKHENDWFLTMGKFKINDKIYQSYEEVVESLKSNQWEIILTLCMIVSEDIINNQKLNNNE